MRLSVYNKKINLYKQQLSFMVCFILLLSVFMTGMANAQFVTNGSFEHTQPGAVTDSLTGLDGWVLELSDGAVADFQVVADTAHNGNNSFRIVTDTLGANQWSIQAVADSIPVTPGKTYDYSVWAKAKTAGAQVNFTVGNYSFNEYGAIRPATLSTEWQEFTMQFTISDDQTVIRAPVHFNYAANVGDTIYIDDLRIYNEEDVSKPVIIEAESGVVGSDFSVLQEDTTSYITIQTNSTVFNPGSSARMATYEVTFPDTGNYDLFVRLRVGSGGFDDDSFFYGNGFGLKDSTVDSDWIFINGLAAAGFNQPDDIVREPGSLGSEVWKWVNLSRNGYQGGPPVSFTVPEDSLTQIFQIGAREDGLDIDKIIFGKSNLYFSVENLDKGERGGSEIPGTGNTLMVDLSDVLRPVSHCASGALYGITEDIPADISGLVTPLKPHVYVQPALAGSGHQQPFGAAIPVSDRLNSTTGSVMIRLADICPNWPYQWPGESSWISQVTSVINEKLKSGRNNYYGYEIWNEHHGTWDEGSNGNFYTQLWKPTFDLIRSLDPEAKIIGPSDSYYLQSRINEFLTFCIDNDCLPDIICWHELQGSDNISSHIDSYRSLESSLGISPREISINEYSSSTHTYEGCPGVSAPFIAKFERKLVNSASISWWFTNLPGRLGSLLTSTNQKGGGWWFYKWYGDMTGNMVNVTPPRENGDGIDGFANLDLDVQFASICLGGNYTGTVNVILNGIPSAFGDSVDVKVEYIPWTSKDTPVSGPITESITTYGVADEAITVPVNITDPLYGYRVYVAPVGQIVAVKHDGKTVPGKFALGQNYPNPFNPLTRINFEIPEKSFVSLKVYNLLGQEVAELAGRELAAGKHTVKFDAANIASGIYFYVLKAGDFQGIKKLIVVK